MKHPRYMRYTGPKPAGAPRSAPSAPGAATGTAPGAQDARKQPLRAPLGGPLPWDALRLARNALATRYAQLANCRTCGVEAAAFEQALKELDALLAQR